MRNVTLTVETFEPKSNLKKKKKKICKGFFLGKSIVPKAGLSIDWIGQVPRGINHSQPAGGATHDTSFKNVLRKCLYYSLEIVEEPYIARL